MYTSLICLTSFINYRLTPRPRAIESSRSLSLFSPLRKTCPVPEPVSLVENTDRYSGEEPKGCVEHVLDEVIGRLLT